MIHAVPHQYAYVDSTFTHREPEGFVPVVWFAVHSVAGRMFGASVLFENGAIYRDIPLHALAHEAHPAAVWRPADAQRWDAYGEQLQVVRLPYLDGLACSARVGDQTDHRGRYLFSLQPLGDDYSREPAQDKTFTLLALTNGRYTCQPTDRVLVWDESFTTHRGEWPTVFKRARQRYSCET